MWASGDFDAVAETTWAVGDRLVQQVGVEAGDEVLDVACGTGNAVLRAAAAGAVATGLDITPELLEAGRARAAAAGVAVAWVEGDAEALPFEDAAFDIVLSTFGCMFAPDHDVTARELARVLRPGGRLGICAWTPGGGIGDFFRVMARHLPPPLGPSPMLWGVPAHVERLFAGSGITLVCHHETVDMVFDSPAAAVELYSTKFGPTLLARRALEREGRWPALRDDMAALHAAHVLADGTVRFPAEYLVALGRAD